jgi:glutathione peroxidase-family protein
MSGTSDFLHPRSRYRGQFKPENLMFNANLQEFAQRVMFISNLETNGKMTPEQSYKEIKALWKDLKQSKKSLGIGKQSPFQDGGEAEAS